MSQKIQSNSFTSFSSLGLALLLGVGGSLIILSWTIEWLVERYSKHTNRSTYQRLEWTVNNTLQLQRIVHEELGLGTWSKTAEDYPITLPGERLATVDISDPEHPKLKTSVTKSETSPDHPSSSQSSAATTSQHDIHTASFDHANSGPDPVSPLIDLVSPASEG